jgi:hypothetical protein
MLASDAAPDLLEVAPTPGSLAPAPRRGSRRILAVLRASMALIAGWYRQRRHPVRPSHRLVEVDPTARLARYYPFFYTHLS